MNTKINERTSNSERILVHYIWIHKKGNYLQIGKGINIETDMPYFNYITDWSVKENNIERYWGYNDEITYDDFLPILEKLNTEKYITMNRIDGHTYELYLRPKFNTLSFVKELLENTTVVKEESNNFFNKQCKINEDKHTITIGGYNYSGFSDLFEQHKQTINKVKKNNEESLLTEISQERIKNKKAKWKAGMRLIFAIIKCREENPNCNIFSLKEVYNKYNLMNKNGRNENRKIAKTGDNREGIKNTDCESAGTVFKASGLQLSVKFNLKENYLEVIKGTGR